MPFNDVEFQRIKKIIGGFCKERIPSHQMSQIKVLYEIKGNEIILFESRPCVPNSHLWSENAVAKFQYDQATMNWKLFYRISDQRWQEYLKVGPTRNLKSLIDEVAVDPYQFFWG